MAKTECELLVMGFEDYEMIKKMFDSTKEVYLSFVESIFNVDKRDRVTQDLILYTFEIKDYEQYDTLIKEGDPADYFYIIYEGSCEIYKTVLFDNSNNLKFGMDKKLSSLYGLKKTKKQTLNICETNTKAIVGHESLCN